MSRIKKLISEHRKQYFTFILFSLLIILFTIILYLPNPLIFQKHFGIFNPIILIIFIFVFGITALTYFISRGWFAIYERKNLRGMFTNSILATILVFNVILIDIFFTYSEDINVLLPQSMLFYPTIGYVVEILFHILPLSLLLIILTSLLKNIKQEKIIWFSIFVVSLIEPIFQLAYGTPTNFPVWIKIYFALHLYLFNFLQLSILKRYDFISMYSFRLVYYLFWHILWGYLRLSILF